MTRLDIVCLAGVLYSIVFGVAAATYGNGVCVFLAILSMVTFVLITLNAWRKE